MLGLRRRNLVGLDVDGSAVRMVQLRKDGTGYTLANAGISDIVPWGDDPDLRRIHTIRAIVAGLSSCGIACKSVVCGLRGPEVVVRDFEFPALPLEEIGPAVELEAAQICPFSTEESTLDYQVTSNTDKKTLGFWVAATNGLIENTRRLVHEAVLRCALIDVSGLALLNLLDDGLRPPVGAEGDMIADCRLEDPIDANSRSETRNPKSQRPAVLDVGDSCTTIAIVDHAGRPFVRDINSGSQEILRRVALDTGLTVEAVKEALSIADCGLRIADSSPDANPKSEIRNPKWQEDGLQDSLERACRDLMEDIATTLRYYAAQHGSGRVDRLLVCGGFATVEEFIELLGTNLYVEVEPWNPVGQMRCEAGSECESLLQKAGPSLAVAAGLALRHV